MILWLVEMGNIHYVCTGFHRETVKAEAHKYIGGDPETYTVTPLTQTGDRVFVAVSVFS